MDNVIVAPHSLGWTDELFTGIWAQIMGQIAAILRGNIPDGLVNKEVLEKDRFQSKFEALRKLPDRDPN